MLELFYNSKPKPKGNTRKALDSLEPNMGITNEDHAIALTKLLGGLTLRDVGVSDEGLIAFNFGTHILVMEDRTRFLIAEAGSFSKDGIRLASGGPIRGINKRHWTTRLTVWWLKKRLKKASPEKQVQFARIMKRNYPDLYNHLLKEVDIVEV